MNNYISVIDYTKISYIIGSGVLMEQVDLFESLVRYYSIKPLPFEHFDLQKAKGMIKSANLDKVIFIDDHLYYEELIEAITKEVIDKGLNKGTVYIHLHGQNCTERLKNNIINLLMSVDRIFIFDKEENWMINDPKIHYNDPENLFANNHQRFFVYQSPGYNVALVSRRNNGHHEGAMANSDEAVSLLAQIVGFKVYKS